MVGNGEIEVGQLEKAEQTMMATRFPAWRVHFLWLAVVLAGLVQAAPIEAQAPGERDALIRTKLAISEFEADIRLAVRQIQRLSQSEPDKAQERLRRLLARIEESSLLADSRRDALARMVKDRIRVAESDKQANNRAQEEAINKQAQAFDRKGTEERRATEQSTVQRLVEGIKQLQKEGKLPEASRQAKELANRMRNSPTAQAVDRTSSVNDQVASSRDVRNERERGITASLREADKKAIPPKDDIEFPKDWKEKTKNRKSVAVSVRMTPREKAIMQALDSPVTVSFKDSPFEAVIEFLQVLTGQTVLVDKNILEQAGVNYETKVTLQAKGLTLRSVLRKILGEYGLAYIVKDETIQVITADMARNMMVTRVHYIGDLITAFDEFRATIQAAQIIELVKTTIDPQSWDVNGGQGKIFYDHARRALIIKQSAEFHGTLSSGLSAN